MCTRFTRWEGVEVPAINGISLQVNQGDFVALISTAVQGKVQYESGRLLGHRQQRKYPSGKA